MSRGPLTRARMASTGDRSDAPEPDLSHKNEHKQKEHGPTHGQSTRDHQERTNEREVTERCKRWGARIQEPKEMLLEICWKSLTRVPHRASPSALPSPPAAADAAPAEAEDEPAACHERQRWYELIHLQKQQNRKRSASGKKQMKQLRNFNSKQLQPAQSAASHGTLIFQTREAKTRNSKQKEALQREHNRRTRGGRRRALRSLPRAPERGSPTRPETPDMTATHRPEPQNESLCKEQMVTFAQQTGYC